jgi:hypothetical protein
MHVIRVVAVFIFTIWTWPILNCISYTQKWDLTLSNPQLSIFGIASDINGRNITAVTSAGIYYSHDRGIAWNSVSSPPKIASIDWSAVSCNAQGSVIVATGYYGAGVYISNDYSKSYSKVATLPYILTFYTDVTVSETGKYIGVSLYSTNNNIATSFIYISNDFGATWTKSSSSIPSDHTFNALDASANFQYVASLDGSLGSGGVYMSSDFGASFSGPLTVSNLGGWTSIACDKLCKSIFAVVNGGGIWQSDNYGTSASWKLSSSAPNNSFWKDITSDSIGLNLAAITESSSVPGSVYQSHDGGITWDASNAPSGDWKAIVSDGAGIQYVAALYGSGIFITVDAPTSQPSSAPSRSPTCSAGRIGDGDDCRDCPAGTHSAEDRSRCDVCPIDTYSEGSSSSCTACAYPASNVEEGSASCDNVFIDMPTFAIFLSCSLFLAANLAIIVAFGRKNLSNGMRCGAMLILPCLNIFTDMAYIIVNRFSTHGLFALCVIFTMLPNSMFMWKLHKENASYPTYHMVPLPTILKNEKTKYDADDSNLKYFLVKTGVIFWTFVNIPIVLLVLLAGFFIFHSGLIYIRSIYNFWLSIWINGLITSNELNPSSLFSFATITMPEITKPCEFDLKSYNHALIASTFLQAIPQLVVQGANNQYLLTRWNKVAIVSFAISALYSVRGTYKVFKYIFWKQLGVEDIPLDFKALEIQRSQSPVQAKGKQNHMKDDSPNNNGTDDLCGIELDLELNSPSSKSSTNLANLENDCGVIAEYLFRKVGLKYADSEDFALALARRGIVAINGPRGLKTILLADPYFLESLNISKAKCKQIYAKILKKKYPSSDGDKAVYPGVAETTKSKSKSKSLLSNSPTFTGIKEERGQPRKVDNGYSGVTEYDSPSPHSPEPKKKSMNQSSINHRNTEFYNENDHTPPEESPSTPLVHVSALNSSSIDCGATINGQGSTENKNENAAAGRRAPIQRFSVQYSSDEGDDDDEEDDFGSDTEDSVGSGGYSGSVLNESSSESESL